MPLAMPALVVIRPSWTNSRSVKTRACVNRWASSRTRFQWVVQERPSSRPASPRMNAPVQTEQTCASTDC